jgi:hypothetical protein
MFFHLVIIAVKKDGEGRRLQREILTPLKALLDHLWETLFHRFLQMGRVILFGTTESWEITALKKYPYGNR